MTNARRVSAAGLLILISANVLGEGDRFRFGFGAGIGKEMSPYSIAEEEFLVSTLPISRQKDR